MNEEYTSTTTLTEQTVENERDARTEKLQNTFSYDGYQVVRKELFAHLRDPAIVIRKDIQHGLYHRSGGCSLCACYVQ